MTEQQARWQRFVYAATKAVDTEWNRYGAPYSAVWVKRGDGTKVTDLDLRIDVALRRTLAETFPDAVVVSEEIGLLVPLTDPHREIAMIDPIDGTESLVRGVTTWWCSVGVLADGQPACGWLYNPESGQSIDSAITTGPNPPPRSDGRLKLGLSPPVPTVWSDLLEDRGMEAVSVQHSANKVSAVISGLCDAAAFLPTEQSPTWLSWDLAGAAAVAREAGMPLRTLDGEGLPLAAFETSHSTSWVCARDEATCDAVVPAIKELDSRSG